MTRERLLRMGVLLSLFAALRFFTPPALPLCGFRWLTGRPCPLCGLTRALFALAKGHFGDALHLHALSPLAAAMLVALIWNSGAHLPACPPQAGRPASPSSVPARIWSGCAVLFAIYGVWRFLA